MRLGLSERIAIEAGIYRRDSLAQIAKQIGISRKSLSKEIRQNRTFAPAAKFNGNVDLLQNVRDNVFAEIISVDVSAFFAGKSTVELFVQLIPRSPVSVLNRLHMFAMFVSFEEAVPVIVPTMLPHRHMLLL